MAAARRPVASGRGGSAPLFSLDAGWRGSPVMKSFFAHSVLAIVVLCGAWCCDVPGAKAGDELGDTLQAWIMQNIRFEKNEKGEDKLFIRGKPVRAYIDGLDQDIVADARSEITNLSRAFNLEHEWATNDINLAIIGAFNIVVDGKPSKNVLSKIGLADDALRFVSATDSWKNGCGIYDGRDEDGRLKNSILVIEKSLSLSKARLCAATGILLNFGLRLNGETYLETNSDYVQFLPLARSLVECERKIGARILEKRTIRKKEYLECLVENMKDRLSK